MSKEGLALLNGTQFMKEIGKGSQITGCTERTTVVDNGHHIVIEEIEDTLIKSHACSVGEEIRPVIIKLMMLLKAHALSLGHSGVQSYDRGSRGIFVSVLWLRKPVPV